MIPLHLGGRSCERSCWRLERGDCCGPMGCLVYLLASGKFAGDEGGFNSGCTESMYHSGGGAGTASPTNVAGVERAGSWGSSSAL